MQPVLEPHHVQHLKGCRLLDATTHHTNLIHSWWLSKSSLALDRILRSASSETRTPSWRERSPAPPRTGLLIGPEAFRDAIVREVDVLGTAARSICPPVPRLQWGYEPLAVGPHVFLLRHGRA